MNNICLIESGFFQRLVQSVLHILSGHTGTEPPDYDIPAVWAPAQSGAQRETKWFYERARGQYADAQSKLTPGEQKRFKAEYPKPQMFTKTDIAKFENVWDDHPKWVILNCLVFNTSVLGAKEFNRGP